ncbi:hypothetical protein [Spirosoma rhododendri]|uniref:Heavy metal-binding domain-containing protein n=1 Tax=Spirosoma rhododendri TaxID=2728024 RepID=A0A7L5DR73_9BACT|nr:hypothetical protein [Spirosoma rhododendri]QJD78160.1 hypothetical protein HH216_06780 [Spirosoma rhododendri]
MKTVCLLLLTACLSGCFPARLYIKNTPVFPVDVFYDNQRPERPFEPIRDLEVSEETPVRDGQLVNKRLLKRGNDMQDKELLLARLTLQAKKLGANALVGVKYTYYTNATDNGYSMRGLAVRYRDEQPAQN